MNEKAIAITIAVLALVVPVAAYFYSYPLQTSDLYAVEQGDTLYHIGLKLGIPWQDIAYANNITAPYTLIPGMKLEIPFYDPYCLREGVNIPIKDGMANLTFGAPTINPEQDVNSSRRVILRFDDGYQDFWTNALPIIAQYGYHGVLAIIDSHQTDLAECTPYESYTQDYYMNWPEVQWLGANGFEISNHTWHHYNMSNMNSTTLYNEIHVAEKLFEEHGIDPKTLTLPYGNGYSNATLMSEIFEQNFTYVYTVTGVEGAQQAIAPYYPTSTQPFVQWHDIDISHNQSLMTFESIVDQANSTYVVGLTFHSVGDDAVNDTYETNTPNFAADMQYLYANHFDVIVPWELPNIDLTSGE